MSWHSKWHNIKHKKALADSKKAKIYTKIAKIIELSAKNWSDPSLNPWLILALEKARYYNVPKDIVERAIKKWSWQIWIENLEEIMYEWYWAWWVAILVKCITSNKNRSSANIRSTFGKLWWNLWEPGSVSWQFKELWVIYVIGKYRIENIKWKQVEIIDPIDINQFEELILETDVVNYELCDEWATIYTIKSNFSVIKKYLEDKSYKIEQAEISYIPENLVDVSQEDNIKLEKLIDFLDDDDDVDTVFHNAK